MIVNTYKKYILRLFSKTLVEVVLIFFSLILIINLFEEINFLRNENVSGSYPVFLSFLNTPSIIFDILPFVFLISTLFFFIKLIDKNELTIFKYTGVTNNQILYTLVIFSFFTGKRKIPAIIPKIIKYKNVCNVFSQPNADKANFVYIGEKK